MKRAVLATGQELHVHSDRFSVYSGAFRLFTFYVESRVNGPDGTDSDSEVRLDECGENVFRWTARSRLWEKKIYTLRVTGKSFVFGVTVRGRGIVENIEYFAGPEGGFGSEYSVAGYTAAGCGDRDLAASTYQMNEAPGKIGCERCAPAPLVFPFYNDFNGEYVGIGAMAPAGKQDFFAFELRVLSDGKTGAGCFFRLPLAGPEPVDGEWESPLVWGGFAENVYAVYTRYSRWMRKYYGFPPALRAEDTPRWWKMPVFCGWGEQCRAAEKTGAPKRELASREFYEALCARLDELALPVGTVIVDDKWQAEYGACLPDPVKWPDMRGFADAQHARGRRLLLWFKCWDAEGLPPDECVTVDGEPVAADPTNPKYLDRLRKTIYTLLSADEGCCDFDGFKMDFMDCFPSRPDIVTAEPGVRGIELMKRLFSAVRRFAEEAKPDALLNMSALHPYLAEDCRMFRLHDFGVEMRNPLSVMEFRSSLARAVYEDMTIDVDGFSVNNPVHQLRVLTEGARCGVPAIYFFPPEFGSAEWTKLREAWLGYINGTIITETEDNLS